MKKYVIEREMPGAGDLSPTELEGISIKSSDVVVSIGPRIQWLHSYVADDKIYCVYVAADEALVREHAERGGFPANRITEVATMIGPETAGRDYVPS